MKSKLNIATALALACGAVGGCSPENDSAQDTEAVTQAWQDAITNTARAYFRLGVVSGQYVNMKRRINGEQEATEELLFKEAAKKVGEDPYIKAQ